MTRPERASLVPAMALAGIVGLALGQGCVSAPPSTTGTAKPEDSDTAEGPAPQQLLLFGDGPVYGVLIPTTAPTRNASLAPGASATVTQKRFPVAVVEVELVDDDRKMLDLYATDRRRSQENLYTFVTEPLDAREFSASGMTVQGKALPALRSLRGDLWRGAPSGYGSRLARDVGLRIVRRVKPVAGPAAGPRGAVVRYTVFGDQRQMFAWRDDHLLRQVIAVRLADGGDGVSTAEAAALRAGAALDVPIDGGDGLVEGTATVGAATLPARRARVKVTALHEYLKAPAEPGTLGAPIQR